MPIERMTNTLLTRERRSFATKEAESGQASMEDSSRFHVTKQLLHNTLPSIGASFIIIEPTAHELCV